MNIRDRARGILVPTISIVLVCAGCLGGQSKQTRRDSERIGDQSQNVPSATRGERDWQKAAQGHGAAGAISAEDLARLDKQSAPGASLDGSVGVDAGR